MDLQPQQKLGQYTVVRKLAVGGMAEIYLATRGGASGFAKTCVLKRVKAEFRRDQKFRQMFEAEAKLAANLEHSNIVQIFDFQSGDDGELYLAMQYVDGCSLDQLRRRLPEGVLPPFLAARIVRDVANALAYAYNAPGPDGQKLRLVHRDISPHNVLISSAGEVKLTDFGIAKPLSRETSGGFKGKIAYMAPEQARGQRTDNRTDIFALGVVLFELVTGSRPYDAPNDIAFIHEMSSGSTPAPRASQMGLPVPEDLADIAARAVERQADLRYQAAEELVRALDGFIRTAQSEVDTDLGRFVTERLGSLSSPPAQAQVPLLPTGAFDETQLRDGGSARAQTAIANAPDTREFAPPAAPLTVRTPTPREPTAVLGDPAPRRPPTPAPATRIPSDFTNRPTAQPPAVDARPVSSQSRPTEKGIPAIPPLPAPLPAPAPSALTPGMRRLMVGAGLSALILGVGVAYLNSGAKTASSVATDAGLIQVPPPSPPLGTSTSSSSGSGSSGAGTTSSATSSGGGMTSGGAGGTTGSPAPAVSETSGKQAISKPPVEVGSVKFFVEPWGRLSIDGKARGLIEGSGTRDIAVGHHRAVLRNDDAHKNVEFDVVSGKLAEVRVNMMTP